MHRVGRIADAININMYALVISVAGLFLLDAVTNTDARIAPLFAGNLIIMILIYLMRVHIRKMPVYVAAHVALLAVCTGLVFVFQNDIYGMTCASLFIALSAFALLFDILFWMSAVQEEKSMPTAESGKQIEGFVPVFKEGLPPIALPFVTVFILGLAFSLYAGHAYYGKICYVLGVIYIGLYFLRIYFAKLNELIRSMHRETEKVQGRLIRANAKLVIPLIVFLIVAMLLFQSDFLIAAFESAIFMILKGFVWLLTKILYFFSKLGGSGDAGEGQINPAAFRMAFGETPEWMKTLSRYVENLLTFVLATALLYLLIRGIMRFIRFFSRRSVNSAKTYTEVEMTEVRERIKSSGKRKGERSFIHPASYDEKIRRLYRRYVRRLQKKGLAGNVSTTPLERVDAVVEMTQRERAEVVDITSIYNKARYNPMQVTKADVAKMEELL